MQNTFLRNWKGLATLMGIFTPKEFSTKIMGLGCYGHLRMFPGGVPLPFSCFAKLLLDNLYMNSEILGIRPHLMGLIRMDFGLYNCTYRLDYDFSYHNEFIVLPALISF